MTTYNIGQAAYCPSTGAIGKVLAVTGDVITLAVVTGGEAFLRDYSADQVAELGMDELRNGVFPTWEQMAALVHRMRGSHTREQQHMVERERHARGRLDAFRAQVREEAIRVAESQGWCDEGLNRTLENLGLDPVTKEWLVNVEVTATRVFTVTISSTTDDQAWRDVDALSQDDLEELIGDDLAASDWSYSTHDASTHVEEA